MLQELTIEQVKKNPTAFLYVFASDKFLNAISAKYASVIRGKRANQNKLLLISAEKYGSTYQAYTDAAYQAFKDAYAMTPAQALIDLAQGKTVAGKNWAEGVFGIGAVKVQTFYGKKGVTVDKTTGNILVNGENVTDDSLTDYENVKGKAIAYGKTYVDADGTTYVSQYDKKTGEYYALSTTSKDGKRISAANGKELKTADSSSIWSDLTQMIQTILDWIMSSFGRGKKTLTEENTIPSQKADGFVHGENKLEASSLLLILLGGGLLVGTGIIGGKKGKKKLPKARR